MTGIVSYGSYIPYNRLQRSAIRATLGSGGGKGTRAVASYDEDTTSMGVEAARAAMAVTPAAARPEALVFATTDPAYLDKTNATALHAALMLDDTAPAFDAGGAVRSAIGALRLGFTGTSPTMVVSSDTRTGLPGGADESNGGDGAAAFVVGGDGDDLIAELIGTGASTAEFLDRWRVPGEPASGQWEERFGEQAYVPLAQHAVTDALKSANVAAQDIDMAVVAGLHSRAVRVTASQLGVRAEAFGADLAGVVGNSGAAFFGIGLADALDRAEPGQLILAVSLADGADAFVFRTTQRLNAARKPAAVAALIESCNDQLPYASFLSWRGMLDREPPRRPEPDRPAAPPSFRSEDWKFGFVASRCEECSTRHLPPQRVCVRCSAVDRMSFESMASATATIATYTLDRLAFSLHPPVVVAVLDFDGGGRFQCELTDVDPGAVRIGDRVEMTFRRLYTAGGVRNYFWKARPIRATTERAL